MKKGLKKALGLLVALSLMVVGSAFSALAADSPEQRQTFSVDLNNFDESQPYSETSIISPGKEYARSRKKR